MGLSPIRKGSAHADGAAAGIAEVQHLDLIRAAILAPSTFNTQPWKFRPGPDGVDVFADYTRRLPVADPDGRELLMSIGAAVMNMRIAAAHLGLCVHVVYNYSGSSEEPLARVRILPEEPETEDERSLAALFPFIARRCTYRKPFLASRVPASILDRVRQLADKAAREVVVSTDGRRNAVIADLVARADAILASNRDSEREMSAWSAPPSSADDDAEPPGVSFDPARVRAARDRHLCLEAPALIAICGDDLVPDWVAAGEFLEQMLLLLARDELRVGYFNVPVQIPDSRSELQSVLCTRHRPQLLLRAGYSLEPGVQGARRPLNEVLLDGLLV